MVVLSERSCHLPGRREAVAQNNLHSTCSATPSMCEENPSSTQDHQLHVCTMKTVGNTSGQSSAQLLMYVVSMVYFSPQPNRNPLHDQKPFLFLQLSLSGVRNRRHRGIRLGGPALGAETLCSFYLAPSSLSFSAIPKRGGIGVACVNGTALYLLLSGHGPLVLSVAQDRCDDGTTDNIRRNT